MSEKGSRKARPIKTSISFVDADVYFCLNCISPNECSFALKVTSEGYKQLI